MHGATQRHVTQRQSVARFDRRCFTGLNLVACLQTFGSDNVTTLTVGIAHQRNIGGAVRIILHPFNRCRNTGFVTTEINLPGVLLLATTDMTTGGTATVIPATASRLLL